MANNPLNTAVVDRAVIFAVKAHSGSERRGKGFPYIIHPLEAMSIAATITSDPEVLAAAVLHDTVEDTFVTIDDVTREFGDRVASLVALESDEPVPGLSEAQSWKSRKRAAIEKLSRSSRDAKIVALGDKLSNMRAIAMDYARQGDAIWNLFHVKDKSDHAWHYRGLAGSLRELEDTFAFQEFESLINQVFGE